MLREILAAQWTFRFYAKPVFSADSMKVVLLITAEDSKFIIRLKRNQADRAVGHIIVFLYILSMGHLCKRLYISIKR